MLNRVRIELGGILGYLLSELFFLVLPDVAFLISILEDVNTFWDREAFLGRAALAHGAESIEV